MYNQLTKSPEPSSKDQSTPSSLWSPHTSHTHTLIIVHTESILSLKAGQMEALQTAANGGCFVSLAAIEAAPSTEAALKARMGEGWLRSEPCIPIFPLLGLKEPAVPTTP